MVYDAYLVISRDFENLGTVGRGGHPITVDGEIFLGECGDLRTLQEAIWEVFLEEFSKELLEKDKCRVAWSVESNFLRMEDIFEERELCKLFSVE